MRNAVATFVLAATLAAPMALAQDRPPIFPTRDVSVTYRVTGGPQPGTEMAMSWLAATRQMRVDLPGGVGFVVSDLANRRGFMVMEAQRMIVDVPAEQAASMMRTFENARFTRGAADRVAGAACTNWSIEAPGQNGTACFTGDGVMLRSQGTAQGVQGGMEAVRVTYGAQDPARYQRPQGYQTMQVPAGAPPRR